MKNITIVGIVMLLLAVTAIVVFSYWQKARVLGLWTAASGASVEFSKAGTIRIHPPAVGAGGSPSAPLLTTGNYTVIDGSHLKITVSGFESVMADYSVTGHTLKLTTPEDGPMVYTQSKR